MRKPSLIYTFILAALLGGAPFPAIAADEEPSAIKLDLGDGVEMKFVLVPAGSFQQGSPRDEAGRAGDEAQRQATISEPFYLSVYPVTRGQFARFVKATSFRTEAETGPSGGFGWDGKSLVQRKEFNWRNPGFTQTDSHPATIITYADANAFNAWLAKKSARPCSLPTEAQWEYACRAGSTTPYYSSDLSDIAWFKSNAGGGTHPVGEKTANAFGLFDMSGNVFQWCRDWYGPYDAGALTDPLQTHENLADKPRHVLRGGSWLREAKDCRSAARYKNSPGSRNADNGFRVATMVKFDKPATPVKPAENAGPAVPAESPDNATPPTRRADDVPDKPNPFLPNEVPQPAATPPLVFNEPPAANDGGSLLWIVLPLIALAAVLFFVFRMVFRPVNDAMQYDSPQPTMSGQNVGSAVQRVVSDGFWLSTLAGLAGNSVHYRCMLNGQPHIGHAVVQSGPNGHFVYTGGTPTNLEILGVNAATGGDQLGPQTSPQPATTSQPTTSQPFRGHPSAY